MYGRPMTPRGGPMMRGFPNVMPFHEHQGIDRMSGVQRHALPSMPQRSYAAPPPFQQVRSEMSQRRSSQPVLVMLALPVGPSSNEPRSVSHMQFAPIVPHRSSGSHGPFYPSVPYSHGSPAASYAVPIQVPVPMPSYPRQVLYHYPVARPEVQRSAPVLGKFYS